MTARLREAAETIEQWRPIEGFEGAYDVSDHGNVRSLPRIVVSKIGRKMPYGGHLMTGMPHRAGHLYVHLARVGRKVRVLPVHRLVLAAFVGPCPDGTEGCHWDGDPSNNHISNLYWGTKSQNTYDRIRHGTHNQARKTECPAEHPYNERNTAIERNGTSRSCRICKRARQRARDALNAKRGSVTIERLVDRMRSAADLIEEVNARDGLAIDTPCQPNYLRAEADRIEDRP